MQSCRSLFLPGAGRTGVGRIATGPTPGRRAGAPAPAGDRKERRRRAAAALRRPGMAAALGVVLVGGWALAGAGGAEAQSRIISVTLSKQASAQGDGYFDLKISFAEDVVGLALDDFTATNATLRLLRSATGAAYGDLRDYLVEVKPAASGTITIDLRGGAARDPTNLRDSRPARFVWDREGPVATISGPEAILQNSDLSFPAADFSIRFSEPLGPNFIPGWVVRFQATNGVVTAVSSTTANPPVYTVTALPAAVGSLTVTLPAGMVWDSSGNGNAAASKSVPVQAYVAPNRQPVLTAPADRSFSQGEAVTAFDIEVTDPDEDPLTVSVSGLPSGLAYSAATGQVSGTVAANAAVKDYPATITADDGHTAAVTATFTVTVNRGNRPPVVTAPADRSYERGEAVAAFGIAVSDPDGDTPTVSVSGLPAGLAYSAATGQVTGTVAADAAVKAHLATVTANDGRGGESRAAFTVTVTEANRAPVITAPGDKSYRRGERVTPFAIVVSDADGDSPTVEVTGLPSGLAWSAATGKVSGAVAPAAAVQAHTVTVTANDGKAPEVSATFTVTVRLPNRAPKITVPDAATWAQGETIAAVSVSATDADGDDLSLAVTGLPAGLACASPSASSGAASCTLGGTVAPDAVAKAYTAKATASDGWDEVRATFTITVTEAAATDIESESTENAAPTITVPADRSYSQGETIAAFAVEVSDADGDTPTVGVTGLPPGLAFSAANGQVSGAVAGNAAVRDYPVTITANDGVAPEVSAAFTITVTRANREPVLTAPGDLTFAQGETIGSRTITARDADGDPLALAVTGLPPGLVCSANPSPPVGSADCDLSGTVAAAAEARDWPITAAASDGRATAERFFTITVTESATTTPPPPQPGHRNSAPVITLPADRAYAAGETVAAFSIVVTDADDDPVAVTVAGLPAGLAFSAPTGGAHGTVSGVVAAGAAAADYPVSIRADDGVNPPVGAGFTVAITAAGTGNEGADEGNSPPVITAPADRAFAPGQTVAAFTIAVTDPDDDPVAVSVAGLPAGLAFSPPTGGAHGTVSGVVAAGAAATDHPISIRADDGVNPPVNAGFTVTVTAAGTGSGAGAGEPHEGNSPPVVEAPGDRLFAPGETVSPFYAAATDEDGDPLAVTLRGLPRGLTHGIETRRGDRTVTDISFRGTLPGDAVPGRYPIRITARDGIHEAVTGVFTVTVLDPGTGGESEPRPLLFSRVRGPDLLYRAGRTIEPEALPAATGGVGLITYAVTPTLPDGLAFAADGRELTGTPTTKQRQTGYRLTATDEAGTRAVLRFTITIVDPPVVTGLRITSRPERGNTYRRGEVIEIAVGFSDRIEVEGTPALPLEVGGRIREMEFAGADGAGLRFRYRVARRDLDPNGVSLAANALSLPAGRLRDSLGTDGDLSHPALPDRRGHRVNGAPDGSLPVLASLRITSRALRDDTYRSGEFIEAEARYREEVREEEVPVLALRIGREVRQMDLVAHRGAAFHYRYRVAPVDRDPDGVSLAANAVPTGAGWLAEAFDARAAAVYAVLPDQPEHRVDGAPQAVGALPARRLTLGAAPARIPLEAAFRGASGFAAESSAPAVAGVLVEGSTLTVTPLADGSASVTVSGRNAGGEATQSFAVTVVTAEAEIAVVGDTLAGLGRSALSSAAAVLGARLRGSGGAATVHLAGRRAPEGAGFGANGIGANGVGVHGSAPGLRNSFAGAFAATRAPGATAGSDSGSFFEQLLAGSAFSLGLDDLTGSAPGADDGAEGGRWTFWGAGDRQSFRGAPGAGSRYDGAPLTAYLGADFESGGLLAGLAWSAGRADTDYEFHDAGAEALGSGGLSTRLMGLHPYLRWAPDARTDLWGIGGVGRGSAELSRSVTAVEERADLGLVFGLAGIRRELASGRRGQVALHFDAGAARLAADGEGAVLGGLASRVFRTRLGLEGSRSFGAATPFVVVNALYDGGDGVTGAGVEIAGGLRAESAGGRAGMEARGRILALRGASRYRETGASVTLRLGPPRKERGLALDLTPAWGAAPGASSGRSSGSFVPGAVPGFSSGSVSFAAPGPGLAGVGFAPAGSFAPAAGGSLGARARYRLGTAAPYTEMRWESARSRQARVGLRLGRRDGRFDLDLLGERQEGPGRPALFRFGLFGRVEF